MTNRRDTRSGAFGGRDRLSPSQHTRIGNGMHCVAPTLEPQSETDGLPVIDWTVVHVIFYADRDAYSGLTARVRAWRWYDKQRDGQSGTSGDEVGRWVFDCDTIVALDPDLARNGRGSDVVWQTRGASKMYWQIVEIYNEDGDAPATYPWVIVQPFGLARNDDPVSVALFDTSCGGEALCCPSDATRMASLGATHWSPADGTATFLAATQLTAAGFPFIVDDSNCYAIGIIVRNAAGVVTEYINGHNGISISATAGVVTVTGAPSGPFVATDLDYYLFLIYQEKAYTEASDSYRSEEIAPLNTKYTQPAYIVNDTDVEAAPAGGINVPSDDGIVMDGYKDIHFQVHIEGGQTDAGANCTCTVIFQGSNDVLVGGVREWVTLGVGYDLAGDTTAAAWTSLGLTATDTQVDFDNWMGKRIRANYSFDTAPEANHPGQVVITERRKAL